MDHYSILDGSSPQLTPEIALSKPGEGEVPTEKNSPAPLQFPAEDFGSSLSEMAERDLYATLQLLAERAQYITGASGAAIALRTEEALICRATAGPSAPQTGAPIQAGSWLIGECLSAHQIARCDDAGKDSRVNQEICRVLGVASIVVAPLLREQEVIGVFELLSEKPYAFDERDISTIQRLAGMILTALEQAEADGLVRPPAPMRIQDSHPATAVISESTQSTSEMQMEVTTQNSVRLWSRTETSEPSEQSSQPEAAADANVGTCAGCGFPVSEGRKLCVDCEDRAAENPASSQGLFGEYNTEAANRSWFSSNIYLIGTILVGVATAAVLLWFR